MDIYTGPSVWVLASREKERQQNKPLNLLSLAELLLVRYPIPYCNAMSSPHHITSQICRGNIIIRSYGHSFLTAFFQSVRVPPDQRQWFFVQNNQRHRMAGNKIGKKRRRWRWIHVFNTPYQSYWLELEVVEVNCTWFSVWDSILICVLRVGMSCVCGCGRVTVPFLVVTGTLRTGIIVPGQNGYVMTMTHISRLPQNEEKLGGFSFSFVWFLTLWKWKKSFICGNPKGLGTYNYNVIWNISLLWCHWSEFVLWILIPCVACFSFQVRDDAGVDGAQTNISWVNSNFVCSAN